MNIFVIGSGTFGTAISNELAKNTDNNIKLCWWCCHDYSSKSLGLPISKNDDNCFETIGNFCSPECTCAYIMDSGSRYGERWKEYELLHEMIQVLSLIHI